MRERAIDQFESIFERASIPVLDIREVQLCRISLVLKNDPLDASVVRIARYLADRFNAAVTAHWPTSAEPARRAAEDAGFTPTSSGFESTAALIGQIALSHSQLALIPEPEDETARVVSTDDLVKGTAPPILLVRTPIEAAKNVFQSILHSLSGNFQQTENFSYSFALIEDGGSLRLLHAIDQEDIAGVRSAMKLSTEVSDDDEQQILDNLRHHGERYLKAVVAASRKQPYEVDYRLRLGGVVETAQNELSAGSYGLLVVGHHEEGYSRITAADYQLMHLVCDVPVLAL